MILVYLIRAHLIAQTCSCLWISALTAAASAPHSTHTDTRTLRHHQPSNQPTKPPPNLPTTYPTREERGKELYIGKGSQSWNTHRSPERNTEKDSKLEEISKNQRDGERCCFCFRRHEQQCGDQDLLLLLVPGELLASLGPGLDAR